MVGAHRELRHAREPAHLDGREPAVRRRAVADLGLNRQIWGFTTGSLAPWFNANAPPGAGVYIHDTTYEAWDMLQRDGTLRRDLRAVWQVGEGDFSIVHHELHMNEVDYQIWTAFRSPAVAYVLTHDGVPIVSVYRKPATAGR